MLQFLSLPRFNQKSKIGLFSNQVNNKGYFSKYIVFQTWKVILSQSGKIGLSYDIKFMFADSVDKKLKCSSSFFILFFLLFLKNILCSKCSTRQYLPNKEIIIKFPSIFKKLYSLKKTVQTIKNHTLKHFIQSGNVNYHRIRLLINI